jgi:hypothetical protein
VLVTLSPPRFLVNATSKAGEIDVFILHAAVLHLPVSINAQIRKKP